MPYLIEFSPEVEDHLRALTRRQRVIVLDAIERNLGEEPTSETRNRKPMRPNLIAPWVLRVGTLRVYYDIDQEPERRVSIRAVGLKERNEIRIGKETIKL